MPDEYCRKTKSTSNTFLCYTKNPVKCVLLLTGFYIRMVSGNSNFGLKVLFVRSQSAAGLTRSLTSSIFSQYRLGI
jgi:hypothetical protein